MKRLIFFSCAFAIACAAAADNIEEIAGASQKEREVRWLWKYAGSFIRACTESGQGCQEPQIHSTLIRLLEILPKEAVATTSIRGLQIQFISEAMHAGVFRSDSGEIHRLAVTGLTVDSPILINSDHLDGDDAQWIGILVHELVHHLGVRDDSTRLPDRVGAAVAAYVTSVWQDGSLADFGHPETRVILFGDPTGDRPLRIMYQILDRTFDQEARPNSRVPICESSERFRGQTATAPLWRVVHVDGEHGEVKMKASARVTSKCVSTDGKSHLVRTNFTALVGLIYKEKFDAKSSWWELPSLVSPEAVAVGNSDSAAENPDLYRTFRIESVVHNQATYRPGDIWRSRVIAESLEGIVPEECGGYLTANRWFYIRTAGAKMFEPFTECRLTSLGNNRWQADLSFAFPAGARSDLFFLNYVLFQGKNSTIAFAVPARPTYANLKNDNEKPALKAVAWEITGLSPLGSYEGHVLPHSFRAKPGQDFEYRVKFTGPQAALDQYLDLDLILSIQGKDIVVPWEQKVDHMSDWNLIPRSEPTADGFILVYRMKLPRTHTGFSLKGVRFHRIMVQTNDFSWTEMTLPSLLEGYVLLDENK